MNKLPSQTHGVTLIELLVVMLIIGIVTTFAVLATGDFGANRQAKASANLLIKSIQVAETQAMLESSVLGLAIKSDGYVFYRFQYNADGTQGSWLALSADSLLQFHDMPSGTWISLISPKRTAEGPQIILSADGNITPFEIDFGINNNPPRYKIIGNKNGSLQLQTEGKT